MQSLPKAPAGLWHFIKNLSEEKSFDATEFLFLNFLVLALQHPSDYLLNRKLNVQESFIFDQISKMIVNLINKAEFLIQKVPAEPKEYIQISSKVVKWLEDPPQEENIYTSSDIVWKIEKEAIMNLTDFIVEHQDQILPQLRTSIHHIVNFTLLELIETIQVKVRTNSSAEKRKSHKPFTLEKIFIQPNRRKM